MAVSHFVQHARSTKHGTIQVKLRAEQRPAGEAGLPWLLQLGDRIIGLCLRAISITNLAAVVRVCRRISRLDHLLYLPHLLDSLHDREWHRIILQKFILSSGPSHVLSIYLKSGIRKRWLDRQDRAGLMRWASGATLCWAAARCGRSDIVSQLVAMNANVHISNSARVSPLWVAARYGHKDCVATLLAANADVGDFNCTGLSPAAVAARHGHDDVARMLAIARADADHRLHSAPMRTPCKCLSHVLTHFYVLSNVSTRACPYACAHDFHAHGLLHF